ncbi:MAG: ribonucleoside triphosphate reductase [Bacillota bacterium]|nr:ribonucleoside triphosphate reductase [Bacillota bacterium]
MRELKVIKRNNEPVIYNGNKIISAIEASMYESKKGIDNRVSNIIENEIRQRILVEDRTFSVEEISDLAENLLMKYERYDSAKQYILYRDDHKKMREGTREFYLDKIDSYINRSDWRVKENSNAHYSYGALNRYITEMPSKDYWLYRVYNKNIRDTFNNGDFHIHDLGGLTIYCCGYSLLDVIVKGIRGVSNIPTSKPAKHFRSLLAQVANLTTIFQNEIMGAVAFSSFDTLTAPFVKEEKLTYTEVFQAMQGFIFQINSNSRMGAEPAFSNLTFDLVVPRDMAKRNVVVAGKPLDYDYSECQKEMDMINKAFYQIMLDGDAVGAPFPYPIPTYNIHDRFDWDNKVHDNLWEMAGKYGIPYFANFINSDMDPEDARSMCCRLRLDKRELVKRNGGLFGSGEKTGSIGVVTLNLPRYAYKANSKEELFDMIEKNMIIAKESLEIKREFLQKQLENGLLPAFTEYIGSLNNHFSTIGYLGANEMCENFLGESIKSEEGYQLTYEVLEFMRDILKDFQEQTDNLYNLEATPAESTAYKLAKKDVELFGDKIFTQGEDAPYYTNSCHVPVSQVENIDQLYKHQHELQALHTGGTVIHNYLETSISGDKAKEIIKYVSNKYKAPYTSLSPVYSTCNEHGFLNGYYEKCPYCGAETESYQRITGYIRPISQFNEGKAEEFKDRKQIQVH